MFNVTQAARYSGVSGTTIRNWSREYADYLSMSANPSPGQARQFVEDDLKVFGTIAAMREQLIETEDIRAALDAGQRLEPMRPIEDDYTAAADQDQTAGHAPADQVRAAVAAAERAIAIYQDRVTAVEARADQLADQLTSAESRAAAAERAAAIYQDQAAADRGRADQLAAQAAAVEARAAAAERELQILRELHAAADPGRKMTFWEWVQSRRR